MSLSPSSGWGSNALSALRRFDAYPKPLDDFRVRTRFGGLMSLACGVVMVLLFASEISDYATTDLVEELIVDTTRSGKLRINLDVVFEKIGCSWLALDAVDVSGEQHIDITRNILKRRLNATDLRPIDEDERESGNGAAEEETGLAAPPQPSSGCGSCYGAENEDTKCCNTCDDVRRAYRQKSWTFNASLFKQCKGSNEGSSRSSFKEGEACQIYGYLEVNRVGGSFHFAPGESFSIENLHVHNFDPSALATLDTSHTIRHLSFGRRLLPNGYGGDGKSPLDSMRSSSGQPSTMFSYFIKIVPTVYVRGDETFSTNQYSVTTHSKSLFQPGGGGGGNSLPGAFFSYELAPVMVRYSERKKHFGHFATGLCAIIGGVFTVAGLVDKAFYSSSKLLQQKLDLGKAT